MTKLEEFLAQEAAERHVKANHLLFKWLSDDVDRADLYGCLRPQQWVLRFQSRADTKERVTDPGDSRFRQDVWLLTAREHVERALTDTEHFSNAPYRVLGSGTFMLGLDRQDKVQPGHDAQRTFSLACLGLNQRAVAALASAAFLAAAVLPLKQRQFDLADLAEQAALRFAGFLFGYEQADHALLEQTLRAAYHGLNYQIVGRHFASVPAAIPEATASMGTLLRRTAELIDLYQARVGRDQQETYERLELELAELRKFEEVNGAGPLTGFTPLLRGIAAQLATHGGLAQQCSGTDLAVIVVGLLAGTVGNIQASVAIAVNEFFKSEAALQQAIDLAKEAWQGAPGGEEKLRGLIWQALGKNPPAAFLPRKTLKDVEFRGAGGEAKIPKDSVVILAMGGATLEQNTGADRLDPLVFGGPGDDDRYLHQCVGQQLVMPVIARIVRGVMMLPGLARSYDPETGELLPLQKQWGIICRKFPLEFNREEALMQSPLIVVMKVRMPVAVHAEALKKVIHYGAPRIEKKLQDAGHVHFASFLFLEGDSKLALFTWYDRDFMSYIEHFALEIGPLFDRIFEHIEDPPPLPVNKFPKEFVDTIRRYNTRPAGDYFFSAYPNAGVEAITKHFPRDKP